MSLLTLITYPEGKEVDINPREVVLTEGENLSPESDPPKWVTTIYLTGGQKRKVSGDNDGPKSKREIIRLINQAAR